MKRLLLLPIMTVLLCGFACQNQNSLAQNARDTAAALGGLLTQAQTQYQAECTADRTLAPCTLITRGLQGQNALITATETYCGIPLNTMPMPDPNTPCKPVASAQAGLEAALNNATQLVTEVKGIIHP